jgi:hypothetical protein
LFQIATEHIAPAETTRILYLRPKINLLAAKTVTVPTTIPPKILIAGPDSNVLAGPINDIRFQLGVVVQKGITVSNARLLLRPAASKTAWDTQIYI